MLEGLQAILEKDIVLSTVNADDLLRNPSRVDTEYQRHVATFIPMGDITEFAKRLIKKVVGAKTPKGLIVAPYGYGKTSTLAFLWHYAEQKDLLAIPPFYCATLLDILKATYAWARYRLQQREPSLVADLEEMYHSHTAATIDAMAERYAQEHGLAPIQARELLKDLMAEGKLVLELTPLSLLTFLEDVVQLALQSGYRGVLVLPDEFQQYIQKGASLRRTIQEFREFIWGLDTRSSALGVIISIPSYAESGIQTQGKDILHRLKKDNLVYRLQEIYTRDFPARLWERYAQAFQLGEEAHKIIEDTTLEAIGQIAEREDLGEGPRTVIEAFKRAILHYQERGTPYSPMDLIDDFLSANIQYQSQSNRLKTVVRQALTSALVDTPEKAQAIKLMAAFPRGCRPEIQRRYNLYETINALSKRGHGELMTYLVEGYTLLGLRSTEGPTQTVDVIVHDFWQGYEEDELHLEAAVRAFIGHLLPRFFERRRGGTATGWPEMEFVPNVQGGYICLIEGTFDPRYPRRRLAIQVGYHERHLVARESSADFQFDFLLNLVNYQAPGKLERVDDRVWRFHLNLLRRPAPSLPEDLQKLQDFVNPQLVTPLLMLSLVDYFEHWEEIKERPIPEGDQAEIQFLSERLVGHAIQYLFDQALAESITPPLRRIGRLMLEEIFIRTCEQLYPHYCTLFVSVHHEKVLDDYMRAMHNLSLKMRRGHTPLQDSKKSLARRFGLGSVATFENRVRNEYAHLMEVLEWKGRGEDGLAVVRFKLHPLEETILEHLKRSRERRIVDEREVPVLFSDAIAQVARSLGYRDEETLFALQLLASRGYIRVNEREKFVYLTQIGLDPDTLYSDIDRLINQIISLPHDLASEYSIPQIREALGSLRARVEEAGTDEEELDEIHTRLNDMEQDLHKRLAEMGEALRHDLNTLLLDIDRLYQHLRTAGNLDREIRGQVAFVQHLNEMRQKLISRRKRLNNEVAQIKQELEETQKYKGPDLVDEVLVLYQELTEGKNKVEHLKAKWQKLQEQIGHLQRWESLLQKTDRLFVNLSHLPDLQVRLTREVIPAIQAHFVKEQLGALPDWEPFQVQVEAVEQDLEERRRHGNETFGQVKEKYEAFLRDIDVGEYRLRTRYTYGEDEDSYHDLYLEVESKIRRRLETLEQRLNQAHVDLLKAKYIHILSTDQQHLVTRMEKQMEEARKRLETLQRSLTITLIQLNGTDLELFGQHVQGLSSKLTELEQHLMPILRLEHELTEDESLLLRAFGQNIDVDVTDLFVSLRQRGEDIKLDDIFRILEHLYRKNRISIRVRRRMG